LASPGRLLFANKEFIPPGFIVAKSENLKNKIINANFQHFGKALVYKNFATQPIQI
jgi:hypothetical protein